jgi:hypothetical protein
MCLRVGSATVSRRRRSPRLRQAPIVPPLAMLDLSQPGERQAHDFLLRATSKRDRMWDLLTLHRQGDVLLCVVRWVHPGNRAKPFSLAEVSLTQRAVCWHNYTTAQAARAALSRDECDPRKPIHAA